MSKEIKKRTFEILESAEGEDHFSRVVDYIITTVIIINVVSVCFETVEALFIQYKEFFFWIEIVSVALFTIEYLLRIWSCTSDKEFRRPILGRLHFMVKPISIIDLIAILPFYLPLLIGLDLRMLRALRLFRLMRVLKIGRYSDSMKVIGSVINKTKDELYVSVSVIVILLVVSSTLMYFIENETQPEVFSSIPAAMWWGVATLTTVGYGDVTPVTVGGKILGTIISFLGIGMFALPTGIIGSGFFEEMQERKNLRTCPHCKKRIDRRH